MYHLIIIRYSEIFLKSEPVKKEFENQLINNIRLKLRNSDIKITRGRHRIYVKTKDAVNQANKIKNICGIKTLSPAIESDSSIKEISKNAQKIAEEIIEKGDGFAVRAKRSKDYPLKSKEIEEQLGKLILENNNCHVNLSNPDKTIFIEINGDKAYLFHKKIKGVGGLPYKTQGKLITLLSGGIDSPVASWMMMRRGCEIIALHFGADKKEIKKIVKQLEEYSVHEIKLIVCPHEKLLEKIHRKAGKYTCIICKRIMYKIAEETAKENNAKGIVTGENVGQVASQTLDNLTVLDDAVSQPVYRPLIGLDKEDIVDTAREIGTFDLAVNWKCKYAPKKPSTRADLKKIKEIEKELDIKELIKECMKK